MTVDPFRDDYVPPVWDASHSISSSGHQTEKALLRIAEVWSDADDALLTEVDVLLLKMELENRSLDPATLNFWESQIDKLPIGVELTIESLVDANLHPVLAHALGSSRPADYIAIYGSRYWMKNLQTYRLRRQSSAGALSAIQANNEEDEAEDAHVDTARRVASIRGLGDLPIFAASELDTDHDGRLIVRSNLFIEGEVPLSALPAGDEVMYKHSSLPCGWIVTVMAPAMAPAALSASKHLKRSNVEDNQWDTKEESGDETLVELQREELVAELNRLAPQARKKKRSLPAPSTL